MLSLKHFELLECIITNLFECFLILLINLLLYILPIIMSEILLAVINLRILYLIDWSLSTFDILVVGSILSWHGSDSRTRNWFSLLSSSKSTLNYFLLIRFFLGYPIISYHRCWLLVLGRLPLLSCYSSFIKICVIEIGLSWLVIKVIIISRIFMVTRYTLYILHMLLWWARLNNNWLIHHRLRLRNIVLFRHRLLRYFNILHRLLHILDGHLLDILWLLLVVDYLLRHWGSRRCVNHDLLHWHLLNRLHHLRWCSALNHPRPAKSLLHHGLLLLHHR